MGVPEVGEVSWEWANTSRALLEHGALTSPYLDVCECVYRVGSLGLWGGVPWGASLGVYVGLEYP